jgi:Heparinase II/III N-terminus/Heparinase II/III-like protein
MTKAVASRIIEILTYKFTRKSISPARLLKTFSVRSQESNAFVETLKQNLRRRFFISDLNKKEFYVSLMISIGGFESIMDDADLVHENRFSELGSSGEAANPGTRIKKPFAMFHHSIWLGKAYWISHNESHAEKFKEIVNDWIDDNPVAHGVNWADSMEVSIRAMNLIVGLLYFIGSKSIDDGFFLKLICSLHDHGVYLRHNLIQTEILQKRTFGSYYRSIASLVGLVYLGVLFVDTETGKSWVGLSKRKLEKEILDQVFEDGAVCDRTMSCQSLVTELFTAACILLELNGSRMADHFKMRLEKMFEFVSSATMPNGTVPPTEDCGAGPVFRLNAAANPADNRELLSVGAVLFDRGDFKTAAGKYGELALLFFGTGGFERFSLLRPDEQVKSSIYPEGGFAFLKTGRDFCAFDFGSVGKSLTRCGRSGIFSFTISGKNPFIIDPVLCRSISSRKVLNELALSTSHNGAVVDGREIVESLGFWSMKKNPIRSEILDWISNTDQDVVEGKHGAYEQLPFPVIHSRKIIFNKRQRTFLLEDRFDGAGTHDIELRFHFAPGLKVVETERNFLALEGEEFALIKFRHAFTLGDWENSPSHGILQKGKFARLKLTSTVPLKIETFIFILSNLDDIHHILNRLT